MTVELFPFRHRDPVTGKWVHARYKATLAEIQKRHGEWELTGPPEYQKGGKLMFQPFPFMTHAEMVRLTEHAPTLEPEIDTAEASLVRVFLRRYVTFCARSRRFAAMQGAAKLYTRLGGARP